MANMGAPEQVVLGRISGLFGVRGWLKVYSYTEILTSILDYPVWQVNGKPFRLEQGKAHGKGIVAKLAGLDDRDKAAELIGSDITVSRDQLPQAGEDEYYWSDLEGLDVVTRDGDALGKVAYLFATGANDVMTVKGERERLLPFIGDVILEVNLTDGVITVDWDKDF